MGSDGRCWGFVDVRERACAGPEHNYNDDDHPIDDDNAR